MSVAVLTLANAARMMRACNEARTWLYFIQSGAGGPVKVGLARDPAERLATLQTANPEPLELLAVYRCYSIEERQIHDELHAHRIRGEWFVPHAEVLDIAAALNDRLALAEFRKATP